MPRRALRSRSLRKMKVKLPGGAWITHYFRKNPSRPVCSGCGGELHGTAAGRPFRMIRMPKSRKRPERPYGGNLCSSCMRKRIKAEKLKI
jgi:large subunit ribosomal protein L34e